MYNTNENYRNIYFNNSTIGGYCTSITSGIDTLISVNRGAGGGAGLFLWSTHWSSGNSTAAGLLFLRFGHSGNNIDINEMYFNAGTSSYTTYTSFFTISVMSNGNISVTPVSGFQVNFRLFTIL